MNPIPLRLPFASLVAMTLISACGGGGGSTAEATLAPASVAGVVSGSPGALSLGGAAMTVSGPVTVNGKSGSIADVQPGDVIVASTPGQTAGLSAYTVTATDVRIEVESAIGSIDLAASTLVVAGQPVQVDALTRLYDDNADDSYSSLTLADFAAGDYVEVSGARQASGAILATRIERKRLRAGQPGYTGIELYGDIAGLDSSARRFGIGALQVDYAGASVEGTLADGVRVEVNGTLDGSLLSASRVEVKRAEGRRSAEVEVEGPVSDLDPAAQTFRALGYRVSYAGARLRGALVDGARIEVEGRFDAADASLILARDVKVKQRRGGDGRADGEVKGALSAVDDAAGSFELGGTGYFVDSATVFDRDDSDATLADLRVGDYVEVKFRSTRVEAGRLYATKVAFDDRVGGDDRIGEFEIEGRVSAFVDAPGSRQLSLNGYVVTPSDSARYYGSRNDNPLTADQFWNGLSVGQRLEVKGTLGAGNAVTGLRFELED
jgi:hypothetical protein